MEGDTARFFACSRKHLFSIVMEVIPISRQIDAWKAVHDPFLQKRAQEELAKRDLFPKRDYSDKAARAAALAEVPGHPLYTFKRENDAFSALLTQFNQTREDNLLEKIRDISIHYAKKGDLLYPHLKVKYGIAGPSDVMWTTDDEIRDELADLVKETNRDTNWNNRVNSVLKRALGMIYQEQNILFPICAVNFTEAEWFEIYHDSKDYAACFEIENTAWDAAEKSIPQSPALPDDEIIMPGGAYDFGAADSTAQYHSDGN